MATELLPVAAGPGNSVDLAIATGEQVTIALKTAAGPDSRGARIRVQIKSDGGEYFDIGELNWPGRTALVITGAGAFRLARVANEIPCGAFRD